MPSRYSCRYYLHDYAFQSKLFLIAFISCHCSYSGAFWLFLGHFRRIYRPVQCSRSLFQWIWCFMLAPYCYNQCLNVFYSSFLLRFYNVSYLSMVQSMKELVLPWYFHFLIVFNVCNCRCFSFFQQFILWCHLADRYISECLEFRSRQ